MIRINPILVQEVLCCLVFLLFMFTVLLFGSAIIPYQPSFGSEATWQEGSQ